MGMGTLDLVRGLAALVAVVAVCPRTGWALHKVCRGRRLSVQHSPIFSSNPWSTHGTSERRRRSDFCCTAVPYCGPGAKALTDVPFQRHAGVAVAAASDHASAAPAAVQEAVEEAGPAPSTAPWGVDCPDGCTCRQGPYRDVPLRRLMASLAPHVRTFQPEQSRFGPLETITAWRLNSPMNQCAARELPSTCACNPRATRAYPGCLPRERMKNVDFL